MKDKVCVYETRNNNANRKMKINIFWSITFYIKGNEKYGTGSSPIIVDSVLGRYSHTYTSLTMEKQKCCNIFCTTDAKTFFSFVCRGKINFYEN